MSEHAIQAVLFDLDGTLLDTGDLLLESFRFATHTVLGVRIPDKLLMAKVGQPLVVQMWDFTDDVTVHDELVTVYRAYNDRVHDDLVKIFPGTVPMLERLREGGVPLGVVTSKRHVAAVRGLACFELEHFFKFLIGSDDWPEHKPHPGPIIHGCELLGVHADSCLYVGDSPYDIQSGNAAGCATAAALWGMFSRTALMAAYPSYVCADCADVPMLLT